ncbi:MULTISPECIES: glucose PTS transporter subunit IIA [Bacillota]|uniref:PTS glucose transporter subunit IIA n=2 Tax=Amedibacillus TaxID=2749846 RepID=A0A7G9GQ43_9FIRM|nr:MULTISPECIES: glucose PTS transporter subunit IIA [Bacillota]QNM12925.1 PTS glucose transporter subunit IIA [[Eubacterium] hominis]MCH4286808.1 glucose PTS transporter subunit IIA [Amedibacillus hominis]RGB58116.1 PTS beta-glucoside transporter subunit EIIBCA [Absiella sp. AM22-9]RGB59889.1 PTS beta-glucoside transporter subunit EIIBCA [Absiella sp. AM10-20]RGB62101.1 PTS beta-glucoside transporter subunit EIIBCA [Absiella sp. AM09-45]
MSNKELAKQIITLLGGSNNIQTALHCVTRLRFNLKDNALADMKAIEQLDGVLGTQIKNDQYQVIIGPMVGDVFIEIEPLLNHDNTIQPASNKKININMVLDIITGIFSPILPALVAGGMLKGIIAMIDGFGWFPTDGGTFVILNLISDIPFYFLPFLLAISSSRKFKVNEFLGICVAGALMYPTFVAAVGAETSPFTFLGFSVPVFQYADSVFPVILGVGLLSIVYKFIDKFIPNVLKMVIVPTAALIITIPLTYLILAPIGAYGGIYLADGIVWMFDTLGIFAGFLLGFFMPLIVLCGMHQSTSPIQITNITTLGYDYLLPISFCHNMAESGASFGAALHMKDAKMRAAALTTSFSAFLGISEPALFTVNVVNKTPLIAAMIANGIGGALTTLLGAKCFAFVMPGITSLPVYANPDGTITNLLLMCVCIISTFIIAAVLAFFLGMKKGKQSNAKESTIKTPLIGKIISLDQVKDETFSSGMMGKGFAVLPEDDIIYAPCSGNIVVLADTKHAIGLKADTGEEILIHVGIDTVELEGKPFEVFVQLNQHVNQGDKLMKVDFKQIQTAGYDTTVPVICTNSSQYQTITIDEAQACMTIQ